jgi:hypothetical protein
MPVTKVSFSRSAHPLPFFFFFSRPNLSSGPSTSLGPHGPTWPKSPPTAHLSLSHSLTDGPRRLLPPTVTLPPSHGRTAPSPLPGAIPSPAPPPLPLSNHQCLVAPTCHLAPSSPATAASSSIHGCCPPELV